MTIKKLIKFTQAPTSDALKDFKDRPFCLWVIYRLCPEFARARFQFHHWNNMAFKRFYLDAYDSASSLKLKLNEDSEDDQLKKLYEWAESLSILFIDQHKKNEKVNNILYDIVNSGCYSTQESQGALFEIIEKSSLTRGQKNSLKKVQAQINK